MNELQTYPTSYLEALDLITTKVKRFDLSDELFREITEPVAYLKQEFDLTACQCLLLSGILNENNFSSGLDDLARFLGCTNIRLLRLTSELKDLEDRGMVFRIERSYRGDIEYRLNYRFLDVLKGDLPREKWEERSLKAETLEDFFAALDELYDLLDKDIAPDRFRKMTEELLQANRHLRFVNLVKEIADNGHQDQTLFTVLTVANRLLNHDDDQIGYHDIKDIWSDQKRISHNLELGLNRHTDPLFKLNILEPGNDGGLFDKTYFHFTREAKQTLLGDLVPLEEEQKPRHTSLITPDGIEERQLFFPSVTARRIEELRRLTSEDKLSSVQSRLKEAGFRFGLNCLFYGAPGTGKTEAVLQLAKSSGRSIYKIDFGRLRSKWVGESEQNVKAVFEGYREICRNEERIPILLFNEADAVFGMRNEAPEKAVDKMENTIQNIILEEMETLSGLLIATTNLAGSLDPAFERRFLYKVKFEKPDAEAREKIWRTMIPGLTDFEAGELADDYPFTGGQIENAARLFLINQALFGESPSRLLTLREYCDTESLS